MNFSASLTGSKMVTDLSIPCTIPCSTYTESKMHPLLYLYLWLSMFPLILYSLGFLFTFHTYKKNTPAKTSGNFWLFIDPGLCGCENRFAMAWSLFTCLQAWTHRMETSCASTLQPFRWFLNSRVNTIFTEVNSIQYPRQQDFHTEFQTSAIREKIKLYPQITNVP